MGARDQQSGPLAPVHIPAGGFRATLSDAGLSDLVQIKCEARARCAVRVTSDGQSGFLFFDAGQIVHAELGARAGEDAALEILSWHTGRWDPCERPWPLRSSINLGWQGLLLRAAQLQDEAERKSHVTLVPPAPIGHVGHTEHLALDLPMQPPPQASLHGSLPDAQESGVGERPELFQDAVRLDADGSQLTGHGRSDELAALAAYVCRMGDIIGNLLALEPLKAFESSSTSSKSCILFRDAGGDTVALHPRTGVDLSRLRAQLHL